jgi:hypothetical protein
MAINNWTDVFYERTFWLYVVLFYILAILLMTYFSHSDTVIDGESFIDEYPYEVYNILTVLEGIYYEIYTYR